MSKTLPFLIKVDVEYPIEIESDSRGNVGSATWPSLQDIRKAITQGTASVGGATWPSLKDLTQRYLRLVAQGRMATKLAELRQVQAALADRVFARCKFCLLPIEQYKGKWWDKKDNFQCPNGEQNHEPQPGTILKRRAALGRTAALSVRKLSKAEWRFGEDAWLVTDTDGTWKGLITKGRSTKLDLLPWKLFRYTRQPDNTESRTGAQAEYVGSLYDRDTQDWSKVLLKPQEALGQLMGVLEGRKPTKGEWHVYGSGYGSPGSGMTKRRGPSPE